MDAIKDAVPGREKTGGFSLFGIFKKSAKPQLTSRQQEAIDLQRKKDAATLYAARRKLELTAQAANSKK